MQINPAALTGTDSASASAPAPKSLPPVQTATQKTTKALISVPRLDFEPIYTELKLAVGEHWVEYKEAVTLFLLGTCLTSGSDIACLRMQKLTSRWFQGI